MNTLRKGDRGTVGFTAGRSWLDGWVDTIIDGDTEVTRLSPEAIARATILPRKLEVGQPVRFLESMTRFKIAAIDDEYAALCYPDGRLSKDCSHVKIANLTPIDSDEPSDDGWREWKGGECPVAGDTRVEYRLRAAMGGQVATSVASALRWTHDEPKYALSDIVAYRIMKGAE